MEDQLRKMEIEDVHLLMSEWMTASPDTRKERGMNEPPKQMIKRWRTGQLKKAMKEKKSKSAKRARTDVELLLQSAELVQVRSRTNEWRSTRYKDMCLGSEREREREREREKETERKR